MAPKTCASRVGGSSTPSALRELAQRGRREVHRSRGHRRSEVRNAIEAQLGLETGEPGMHARRLEAQRLLPQRELRTRKRNGNAGRRQRPALQAAAQG